MARAFFALGQGAGHCLLSNEAARVFRESFEDNLRKQLEIKPKGVAVRAHYVLDVVRSMGAHAAQLATRSGSFVIFPNHLRPAIDAARWNEAEKYGKPTDFCRPAEEIVPGWNPTESVEAQWAAFEA